MSSAYVVVTQPTSEPIVLDEAKAYMRVDFGDDDMLIAGLITRARGLCELITGRALRYQQVQEVFTIERPPGGELSGPLKPQSNWYAFNEMLGANPFGPAHFYFDLDMPPIDRVLPVTIETKVTAFDPWTVFPQVTNTDGSTNTWVDYTMEPARIYIQNPITANFYRFTFWCGHGHANTYPLPGDLKQALLEGVAYLYDYREAEDFPCALNEKLLARRSANAWI
jgi:hypothetical protein